MFAFRVSGLVSLKKREKKQKTHTIIVNTQTAICCPKNGQLVFLPRPKQKKGYINTSLFAVRREWRRKTKLKARGMNHPIGLCRTAPLTACFYLQGKGLLLRPRNTNGTGREGHLQSREGLFVCAWHTWAERRILP